MSFPIDQVVVNARAILQDPLGDRYAEQRYVDALNMALAEMQRIRPDIPALFAADPGFPYALTDLDQGIQLPVDGKYLSPITAFVAGWIELADDEFTVDNRAATLLTRFGSQLTMGG